ncbi:MAG: hypothetical protein HYY84_06820 [Deltaproteobacteria bacterium]|nr:hypothetical protein [Deltaproteobacteria bacterium]
MSKRTIFSVLFVTFALSCKDDPAPGSAPPVVDAGSDAGADAGAVADGGSGDAGADAGGDAGADAGTGADAGADAGATNPCGDAGTKCWRTAESLGAGNSAEVAIDPQGNVFALLYQYVNPVYRVIAKRFNAALGIWGDAGAIDGTMGSGAPAVAVDTAGNAVAVWSQFDGTWTSIYANRYSVANGQWGTPTLIEADDRNAVVPLVGVDAYGNATVVWTRSADGGFTDYMIYANRYTADGGTWGAARLMGPDGGNVNQFELAVNPMGNAVAVFRWQVGSEATWMLYANHYNVATGVWGDAGLVDETSGGQGAYYPAVGIDIAGNAVAVWVRIDGSYYSILASRYAASSGTWGDAGVVVAPVTGNIYPPRLATDPAGNVVAVWPQADGGTTSFDLFASRYSADAGTWGSPVLVDKADASVEVPRIAGDALGNATAVWRRHNGSNYRIYFARYSAATNSWGDAGILPGSVSDGDKPRVAVNPQGDVAALWEQASAIWANLYR